MLGCLLTTQQTQKQRVGLQISSGLSAIHLLSPVESSQFVGMRHDLRNKTQERADR